ncbi:MAG TPA: hypothetical protein VLX90_07720 [Steroidobacteraceae bacterium]|nr:hypothetical protein [Steroidobacteraceae bacterium]
MTTSSIEVNFSQLYQSLMKTNFMTPETPKFGARPQERKVKTLVSAGDPLLPAPFRDAYSDPLLTRLDGVFARLGGANGDPATLETLTGCVYQHTQRALQPPLNRFLAVISNLYRSFLDNSKRGHLDIPLKETLPPLAVFQSDPSSGPFTMTVETVMQLIGGDTGVVSMPHTFADHPLFFGSLAHETGGHDVIHADTTLMPQLQEQVYELFADHELQWMGLLWDYWMDETAADVYGVLNVGPSFAYNLAMLLAIFIAQQERPVPKVPRLRTSSDADEQGALDPHPTDILRLSVIQGVLGSLTHLDRSTIASYQEKIARLARALAPGVTAVQLNGLARVRNGRSMNFQNSVPLSTLQSAAAKVGAMIATTSFAALAGHSVQDIETWDDGDENAAHSISGLLQSGTSIVSAGDDAQIIAGLTLAALDQPTRYLSSSRLANDALDDSFATDPYWGAQPRDRMVLPRTRSRASQLSDIDPNVDTIINYNPLDEDTLAARLGLDVAQVNKHQIQAIPWPQGLAPEPDPSFVFKGEDAQLPKADFVIFTWTVAEANAMAAVMSPGIWAQPGSGSSAPSWHIYTNQWAAKFAGRSFGRAPAAHEHYIGKYLPIRIGGKRVLLFKSNFHLAYDDKSMPVKDMFKQVIAQTEPRLVISSGTAGAIGSRLKLGDAVIANSARFHCGRAFKSAPFNNKSFTSNYRPSNNNALKTVNSRLVEANAGSLAPERKGEPTVYSFAVPPDRIGEPFVIVTTDEFQFDDKTDKFGLQSLGAMVEMDDAVLGLAVQEMGHPVNWLAIRNASDPQMPGPSVGDSTDIFRKYGYWTSIPSALGAWASVIDF